MRATLLAAFLLATPLFAVTPMDSTTDFRPTAQFGGLAEKFKKATGDAKETLRLAKSEARKAADAASERAGLLHQYGSQNPAPAPANTARRIENPSVSLEISVEALNKQVVEFLKKEKPRLYFEAPLEGSYLELRDGSITTDPKRNLVIVDVLNSPANVGFLGSSSSGTVKSARLELAPRLVLKDGKVTLVADAWLVGLDVDTLGNDLDRVAANLGATALKDRNPVVETDVTDVLRIRQESDVLGKTLTIDIPPKDATVVATERGLLLEVAY